jgi:SP family arabinose:H+ symporter-like MFS transporter
MYIAEVSPARVRGRLVALQQLAIVVGILLAFISNSVLLNTSLEDAAKWRWMFAVEAIPAAMFFLFLLPVPESPRWMVQRGRRDTARETLARVGGDVEADRQMGEIEAAITTEVGTLGELLRPGLRTALVIGVVLAILQQVSGINAIMYYAPRIFEASGSLAVSAFAQSVLVGLINLLFTLLGMALVDRVGRKLMLVIGAAGMAISLLLVGAAFAANNSGAWLLVPILGYVACFAASTGVVTWVIIAEIFPNRVRGRAMSVAVVALWAACYLVSQTFPMLLESVGAAWTFFGYAAMNVLTFLFAWGFVPETKGRTLEEIEKFWQ